MQTVELKTAYHWHCESCAAENFAMPEKAELTDEEREEIYRDYHDLDEWDTLPADWRCFELVHVPDLVKCRECGTEFKAIDERDVDADDGIDWDMNEGGFAC